MQKVLEPLFWEAVSYYDSVVKPLHPERVILHIGSFDIDFFKENAAAFDNEYRKLVEHIRKDNIKCNIGIVSLDNAECSDAVKELNKHLRMIAESMRCEYEDISIPHVWNRTMLGDKNLRKNFSSGDFLWEILSFIFPV